MSISDEVKRLQKKWDSAAGWPKRLEWLRLTNVRGWRGQRINFNFPIVAIVGENGSGKSTILQSAAAVYRSPAGTKNRFPSDFFPDTAWERQRGVELEFSVREGDRTTTGSVRKRTERWLGNPDRRERQVFYFDLSRLQPIATRVGYARIARAGAHESNATSFNEESVGRLTAILGRLYSSAKKATSSIDKTREVTVLTRDGKDYSGFHQGAGEMTIAELVSQEVPKTSLVLIDEVETSLHPRAQRRLVRDLAEVSRLNDIQFILTTHSPYVLDALPSHARLYISNNSLSKEVLTGVTSHYAMSKMDDASHFNVDVYVEDKAAKAIIDEVLALDLPNEYATISVSPCGPSSVAKALGQMVEKDNFQRPTVVFLDGDEAPAPGCNMIPGNDAPEKVVFTSIRSGNLFDVPTRLSRAYADVWEAMETATTLPDHHDWVSSVSNDLRVPPETVWQVLASEWVHKAMTPNERRSITDPISAVYPD